MVEEVIFMILEMIVHIIVDLILLGLWMVEHEPLYLVVFGLYELFEILDRINDNIRTLGEGRMEKW